MPMMIPMPMLTIQPYYISRVGHCPNQPKPEHAYLIFIISDTTTAEPVLGDHLSGQSKIVRNERVVAHKRLFYYVPSLFWARFGGWG